MTAGTSETGTGDSRREGASGETDADPVDRLPTVPPERDYDVPDGAAAATCPDCGRPFPDEALLALHRGHDHDAALDDGGREAVERARAAEAADLRLFRIKALGALVLLYFGLLMVYAVVT